MDEHATAVDGMGEELDELVKRLEAAEAALKVGPQARTCRQPTMCVHVPLIAFLSCLLPSLLSDGSTRAVARTKPCVCNSPLTGPGHRRGSVVLNEICA